MAVTERKATITIDLEAAGIKNQADAQKLIDTFAKRHVSDKVKGQAMQSAMTSLKKAHKPEFDGLYKAELKKRGINS